MQFRRSLTLPVDRSFFLFGARNTGKSTLIRETFQHIPHLLIDLLDIQVEHRLRHQPDYFKAQILALPSSTRHIIVDEIQKIPELLNLVHSLIETTDKRFILTGSSARKLMKGHANLLAGRAVVRRMFPFTSEELGEHFNLTQALSYGLLPPTILMETSEQREDFLRGYAHIYLKEEVWAEHLIRKLEPFQYFLEVAAAANGEILSFRKMAREVGVDDKALQQYFSILEDTLIGFHLTPYRRSFRKRLLQNPKFYFFDSGVTRALARTLSIPVLPGTYEYGKLFEHFIILECYKRTAYFYPDYRLSYLRTYEDLEIDLIVERPGLPLLLIEIKSSPIIKEEQLKNFQKITQDFQEPIEAVVLANTPDALQYGAICVYPWQIGLDKLFRSPKAT